MASISLGLGFVTAHGCLFLKQMVEALKREASQMFLCDFYAFVDVSLGGEINGA